MKLSTRAEYGIRVLVALAHADGERPTSLAGIARADKLPHAYIEQLVGALRRAGLVTATRGHSGGYRLARPAEQISLVDGGRALDSRSTDAVRRAQRPGGRASTNRDTACTRSSSGCRTPSAEC